MSFENSKQSYSLSYRRAAALAATVLAIGFTADKMAGPDRDGCDSKPLNPGSWVICPVIDGGHAITRLVFSGLSAEATRDTP